MVNMCIENFSKDSNYPFCIQYGSHEKDLYMHTHADFSELVVVINGTAMHKVDNEAYFIKKGDVFVISNDTMHGYENTNDFKICNIMYRPDMFLSPDSDIRRSAGFHALFVIEPQLSKEHSFKNRLKLQLYDFEQVVRIISIMVKEYESRPVGWKTMINSYFMLLVVILSRAYNMMPFDVKADVINIAKSISFMECNYTTPISIQKLSAESNFSVRQFSRIFRDTYKMTPGHYILILRIQHACLLLKNTALSIAEIAFQSGFNDSNYFSRQFHKMFRITPSEYRNQFLE
jgi:Transcriptional regulator containing an amidase domain and an AraC-type DNA-binding HTH domain